MHPKWALMYSIAMAMAADCGGSSQRNGYSVEAKNVSGPSQQYPIHMGLFNHLNVPHDPLVAEHEEAGRFIPLPQVKTSTELAAVIANVSALLHLDKEPHALAAVQYCISELI